MFDVKKSYMICLGASKHIFYLPTGVVCLEELCLNHWMFWHRKLSVHVSFFFMIFMCQEMIQLKTLDRGSD